MEQNKNIEQEKEFSVDFNETKLSLKFTAFSDSLKILLIEENNKYENIYNLEDLSKINIGFRAMKSIQDLFKHFITLIEKGKYVLKKVNENEFDLILEIIFIADIKDVTLQLYQGK